MQSRFTKVGVLMVALLFVFTSFAFGQGAVAGAVSGTVEDAQGAVIAGAKITAKDASTNTEFKTESNATGNFRLAGLPPGTYNVIVEAPKFAKLQTQGVLVNANRDTAMGALQLKVGGAEEVVNVEGTAPIIETTSAQITTSFNSKSVQELPIGTAFDSLALLIPGATSAGDAGFSNTNGADLSVNGQRARSNNFQLDGQSNNDNSVGGPSLFVNNSDLIAEFQVVTNNFSAEYGRNMGSVVNYVTKAGTNKFHGTAYEAYDGNWAHAKLNQERSGLFGFCEPGQAVGTVTNWTDSSGCAKAQTSRYVDNRFGGTLGGPIWKDKAWFFGSYVMQRIRTSGSPSSSGSSITPTPAGLTTLTGAFPGNPGVNALTTIGPYAIAAGNPTVDGSVQNLLVSNGATVSSVAFAPVTRSLGSLYNDQQWSVRGDWQISSKDRFFARYIQEDTDNTNATGRYPAGMVVDVPGVTKQIGLDWSRSWTNNFVNQVRFSYSRADFGFEGGTTNCSRATILDCPSGVSFASAGNNLTFGLQNNLPQGRLVNNTQYQDNASWVIGRHTLKFGGEYDRQRSPSTFLPNVNGTFTFGFGGDRAACNTAYAGIINPNPINPDTGLPDPTLALSSTERTQCAFSNYLANVATNVSLADGPFSFNFKEQDLAFYFQDDWRMKDNLTFNLGLRWEWNQQAMNLLHNLTVAQQSGSSPFWNTSLPLDRTTIAKVPEDLNNFGPNIGFAYTPRFWKSLMGEDKTVIRGGFRIAYDPAFYNIFLNMATAAPVVNASTITAGVPGLPSATPTGASLRAAGYFDLIPTGNVTPCGFGPTANPICDPGFRNQTLVTPDFHNPYTEQWSLGIQRSLGSKMAYEIRYVGNHTIGNFQTVNANPLIRSTSTTACNGAPFTNNGAATNTPPSCLARDFPNVVPSGITPCTTGSNTLTPGFGRADCNRRLVRMRANTAFSNYHSLQQEFRVQGWHGLTASVAYTWSKAIDNVSEIFGTFAGGVTNAGAQNPFDTNRGERGISATSYPHVVTSYFIYELPWYKNQSNWMGRILGGWQTNMTYRYNGGQVFNPTNFIANGYCDTAFAGGFFSSVDTCRPVLSNAGAPLDTVGQYIDSDASAATFTPVLVDFYTGATVSPDQVHWIYNDNVASRVLGSPFLGVGRNTVRGQDYNQVNFGLFKNTKITESVKLQLQATVNNLFNRQYRGTPDPFIDDGRFDISGDAATNPGFNPNGSFMNNWFNNSVTGTRRRVIIGAKIVF